VLNKGEGRRVVAVSGRADPVKIAVLEKKAKIIITGKDEVDLQALIDELGAMGIRHIMVEGGGTLIAGFIKAGLVDEIYAYIGNIIIGGKDAPTFAEGEGFVSERSFPRLLLLESRGIGDGILLHWKVKDPDLKK
jgi:2,5-diamino-6-(ribosylamino)-4(3H)-pyrimidinone 5'-phosphate reductase